MTTKRLLFAQPYMDDFICIGRVKPGHEFCSTGYNGDFTIIEVEQDFEYKEGTILPHPYGFNIQYDGKMYWKAI